MRLLALVVAIVRRELSSFRRLLSRSHKLLDCPFFPPMQAPAASYGAFGSVAAEGIGRSGNCLPAQLGLGCIMPTNRFDAGVPGGVFAGAERAHAPNPLNLSR